MQNFGAISWKKNLYFANISSLNFADNFYSSYNCDFLPHSKFRFYHYCCLFFFTQYRISFPGLHFQRKITDRFLKKMLLKTAKTTAIILGIAIDLSNFTLKIGPNRYYVLSYLFAYIYLLICRKNVCKHSLTHIIAKKCNFLFEKQRKKDDFGAFKRFSRFLTCLTYHVTVTSYKVCSYFFGTYQWTQEGMDPTPDPKRKVFLPLLRVIV